MDRTSKAIMTMAVITMFIVTSLAPLVIADHQEETSSGSRASVDPWVFTSAGFDRQAIYDMAVGEVDPTSPGLEVLVTGGGGMITQFASDTFEAKAVYSFLLTQHAVDIGDVLSEYPGNEIVSVGWDKKVHVLHRGNDGQWVGDIVWESIGSLNGAAVGEFNQSHPGQEIAVTGDEAIVAILTEDPSVPGGWSVTVLTLNVIPITNMMVHADDILTEWPGDEMLVGSFSGHAYLIRQDGQGGWNSTVIWRDDFAILGFGTGGDLVPNITGPEIYISGFSGKVAVAYDNGTNWTVDEIFQDRDPMYAVVPADVDPRYPGPELVAAGIGNFSQGIHVVRYDNSTGNWSVETVKDPRSDGSRLSLIFDIKVAELDSSYEGLEIMIGGFFQELIELTFVEPSFTMSAMPPTQTVVSGVDAEFWLTAEAVGNFEDQISYSSEATGVTFSPSVSSVGELVRVTVPTTA